MEFLCLLSFARIAAFENVCYFGPPCIQAHDRVGPYFVRQYDNAITCYMACTAGLHESFAIPVTELGT